MKKLLAVFTIAVMFIFCFSMTAFAEVIVTVTSAKVNLRSGPATSFDKVGLALLNDEYKVLNEQDGWYQIVFPNEQSESAWIISDYVKASKNDILPKSISAQTTGVNVRQGAGTEHNRLGQLEFGEKYAVIGESGYWYEIRFTQEQNAFVAKWLCLTWEEEITFPGEDIPDEPLPPADNPFDKAGHLKQGMVNTDDLNLRAGPSTSTDILASLPLGTAVAIKERADENWFSVITQSGQEGFVYSEYIDLANTSSSIETGKIFSSLTWDENAATVGVMELSVAESSYGVHITITADIDIVYRMEEIENGYLFISDMSFSGASGTLNNITWKLSGNHYNRLSITSENGIFYRIEESNNKQQIDIIVSAYPVLGKIIYIDPGHSVVNKGILDPGAIGPNGTKENVVVLAISQKVKDILEKNGATVYLTHEGRSTLTRPERCSLANNIGADIFVSIHANSSTSRSPKGTSVYTYAPKSNTAYDREKRMLLGENILQSILDYTGLKNLGLKETGFDVLVFTKMPAVLVETAFISNPEEEKLLADPEWQQLMAEAIANGICEYFYALDKETK